MAISNRVPLYCTTAIGAILGIIHPVGAYAQSKAQDSQQPSVQQIDSSASSDDIVVTAQRKSESLQKVPIAVTAISPVQLKDSNILRLQDLQALTPSLTIDTGYTYASTYIRGVGASQVNNGLEVPVATYVDGAYQERSVGVLNDFFDVASIQVLKGPQGTLYGRNATGGAILIESADPTFTSSFTGSFEAGTQGHYLAEAVGNAPLSDSLALRIGFHSTKDGGYVRNLADGRKMGGRDSQTYRGKLLWEPNGQFRAVGKVEFSNTSDNSVINALRFPVDPEITNTFQTNQNTASPAKSRYFNANLKLSYDVGGVLISSVTNYHTDNWDLNGEGDYTPVDLLNYHATYGGRTWTENVQASTDLSGWINGVIGFDYLHDRGTNVATLTGLQFPPSFLVNGEYPQTHNITVTESKSVFAEAYLTPVERLKITLGGRYTWDTRSLSGIVNGSAALFLSGGTLTPDSPTFFNRGKSSSFTPRFVVAYDFDTVNVYASYNKGFKAGGFSTAAFANKPYIDPENNESYEVGAKFVSPDHRVRVNLAAFHYRYTDIAVSSADLLAGGGQLNNAGAARGNGVEADGSWSPASWLTLMIGGNYLDAKYTKFDNAVIFVPGGAPVAGSATLCAAAVCQSFVPSAAGSRPPRAPKFTGYVGINIKAPISDTWTGNLNVTTRYSSSYLFNVLGGGTIGGDRQGKTTIMNITGSIGPRDGKYKIGFYVNNVTNELYYGVITTIAPAGEFYTPSRKRAAGVRLSVDL